MRKLISPAWPIVIYVISPVVKPCWHAFLSKDGVEVTRACKRFFLPSSLTNANDDATLAIHVHPRMIGRHVAEEILRRISVCEFVAIIWESVCGIIQTAHSDECVEQVWTAEEEVCCMECSHRAARNEERLSLPSATARNEFIDNVVEPALMLLNAPAVVATEV